MDSQDFLKSDLLRNVPQKKVEVKIKQVYLECEKCSKENKPTCKKCRYITNAFLEFAKANIPVDYWHLTMSNHFTGSDNLKNIYTEITSNIDKFYLSGNLICFAGPHGVGKTMTSCCILKECVKNDYACLYTTLSDIVSTLMSRSFNTPDARKELLKTDVLIIDEFDSRFMPSENSAELFGITFENVFRTRMQNNLPTIMCTNSPNIVQTFSGSIKQSLESIASKIRFIPVFSEDYRKKNS